MEFGKPTPKLKLCETRALCLCDAALVNIWPVQRFRGFCLGLTLFFFFFNLEGLLRLLSKEYLVIT